MLGAQEEEERGQRERVGDGRRGGSGRVWVWLTVLGAQREEEIGDGGNLLDS